MNSGGYDVLSQTRWIPVVTFLQVSADMAVAVDVPDGHGHHYVADVADGWAAVLSPPGWTPEKTARLRAAAARQRVVRSSGDRLLRRLTGTPLSDRITGQLGHHTGTGQRVVATDHVGGVAQADYPAARPPPGWTCSPPNTRSPTRRPSPTASGNRASLVGSQRHSRTLRSTTRAPGTSPSRNTLGLRPDVDEPPLRAAAHRAPRRRAADDTGAGRLPGRRRCGSPRPLLAGQSARCGRDAACCGR